MDEFDYVDTIYYDLGEYEMSDGDCSEYEIVQQSEDDDEFMEFEEHFGSVTGQLEEEDEDQYSDSGASEEEQREGDSGVEPSELEEGAGPRGEEEQYSDSEASEDMEEERDEGNIGVQPSELEEDAGAGSTIEEEEDVIAGFFKVEDGVAKFIKVEDTFVGPVHKEVGRRGKSATPPLVREDAGYLDFEPDIKGEGAWVFTPEELKRWKKRLRRGASSGKAPPAKEVTGLKRQLGWNVTSEETPPPKEAGGCMRQLRRDAPSQEAPPPKEATGLKRWLRSGAPSQKASPPKEVAGSERQIRRDATSEGAPPHKKTAGLKRWLTSCAPSEGVPPPKRATGGTEGDALSAGRGGPGHGRGTAGCSRTRFYTPGTSSLPSQVPRRQFHWQKIKKPRKLFPFTEKTGLKRKIRQGAMALDFFMRFFTMEAMTLVVKMTNLNTERKIAAGAKLSEWEPLTVPEFQAFLGLTMLMGIVRMPSVAMYWEEKNWITDLPSFNKVMSRDRFKIIWKYLHFCDENDAPDPKDPQRDTLYKIRPFLELLVYQFGYVYIPQKELAIDESMVPSKGRLGFRQFVPSKRAKYGVKVFVVAESKTGYVSGLQVYTGSDRLFELQTTKIASRIVDDLIEPFERKGYHLYLGNFYTSPALFLSLHKRRIHACGTVRFGRSGFPKELHLVDDRSERGNSDWRTSGPLLAQSWQNNRPVYFLSTIHNPEYPPGTPQSKRVAEPSHIPCPPLFSSYNRFKGGVNLSDRCGKYYGISRRTHSWCRKLFFYLTEVAMHNSKVAAVSVADQPIESLKFRVELINLLIGDTRAKKITPQSDCENLPPRLLNTGSHMPEIAAVPRVCKMCSLKSSSSKKRSRSRIRCPVCDIPLCVGTDKDCFREWHTKKEL